MFECIFQTANDRCLGRRAETQFDFYTFNEVNAKTKKLAQALAIKAGITPKDCVGIYSANCPEWCVTAFACASSSFVLVPLYDTLGAQACTDIIDEVEMKILFVDTYAAAQRILHQVENRLPPSLEKVVVFNCPGKDVKMTAGEHKGIEIIKMHDFLQLDGTTPVKVNKPEPDDLYMIQYTSGTTGRPKGVMLTHGNFTANVASVMEMYRRSDGTICVYTPEILCLHYLPLAHSYGQLVMLTVLYVGGAVGFFGGNIQKLLDDAALLRPTWLPLVPRLMNKLYAKVNAEVERKGGVAAKLFHLAYRRKRQLLLNYNMCTKDTMWDLLVFRKLQAKLGGRVEFMLTTSAPVAAEVLEFWRVVFGSTLIEAYGQTEATALVTASYSPEGGNVGHPVTCSMVKLDDVPELGYFAKDGRGEICIKGPNVMKGYYKQPEKTAETLDADQWLHTGDIGEFHPVTGTLRLIDRKKHIFKLAQGEYIAPEKIESVYAQSQFVAQVYVDGDALQWFTVGVVVPDPIEGKQWAVENGYSDNVEIEQLCKDDKFKAYILKTLTELGKNKGLNQLEQIRAIYLSPEAFTVDNDLLTPSMKNRRPQLRKHFKEQIDKLYNDFAAKHGTPTAQK